MLMKKPLLLAISFVIAGLGAYLLLPFKPGTNTDAESIQTKLSTFRWETGTSQRYRVSMDSAMRLNALGKGNTQNVQVKFNSQLELTTLEADQDKAKVGMQLSDVQLTISGKSDAEMNQALEKPFRVQFTTGGVPGHFEFSEGLTGQEQSMLKNIVQTFTVSMVSDNQWWEVKEKNVSGEYLATYQRVSTNKLKKSKKSFTSSSDSPVMKQATISSIESIELGGGSNWISRMTVDETIQTSGTGSSAVTISNYAQLEFVSSTQASISQEQWDFAAAEPQPFLDKKKESLANLTPEQAREMLIDEVAELDMTADARSIRIHKLKDLLQVDGSLPATLLEQLQTQELTDRTRADLYLALELAATEEAQEALTKVMTNPAWSTRDALRATVALAGINNPSAATLSTLWNTAYTDQPQISSTATYTLGSIGSRMKEANNPDYPALRDQLINGAYSSRDVQQQETFIYALGNTRDPEVVSNVSPFLDSDQPGIRRAAALSLGLMTSEQSAQALVTRFQQENNSEVRGAMAESLTHLPLADSSGIMSNISHAIQSEKNESARYSMAKFMGTNLARHPEYASVLKNLIRTEPSKRVRQVIGDALATNSNN